MSEALKYHAHPRPGKIEVVSSKPLTTQADLSLGYTPGVAEVCNAIAKNPEDANLYTSKSNLVAVITNGTAVLGLGNIGPLASKPVMEGKAVLFKKFAGIDVFDIELDENDPDALIDTIARMAPTFGGINLEDIKAPECFYIERELKKRLKIPVLHDDQHGTAIIVLAAFINAMSLTGKKVEEVNITTSGAGAAGFACMELLHKYGVPRKNITFVDIKGVIHAERDDVAEELKPYAHKTKKRTLAEAVNGADLFFGLSAGGILKPEMLKTMAAHPIIFAMANPTPEIMPDLAKEVRPDAIIGTGRSDFPNQINNVLGFPYLFRGALDCGATTFNTEMKLAAAEALAKLARQSAEPMLAKAYKGSKLKFGADYIIPKPFDARLLATIAPAVAKAAEKTGVATRPIEDYTAYVASLTAQTDQSFSIMRQIFNQARAKPGKIVYPEGEEPSILQTAEAVINEGIAHPILLARPHVFEAQVKELGLNLIPGENCTLINPQADTEQARAFTEAYYTLRERDGLTRTEAAVHVRSRWMVYGCMLVQSGQADAMVCGVTGRFMRYLNTAAHIINGNPDTSHIYALQLVMNRTTMLCMADTHVQQNPTADQLAELAHLAASEVKHFGISPRIALLSHSNFGSSPTPQSKKMKEVCAMVKATTPDMPIEGEMQADTALNMETMGRIFPHSTLKEPANVLLFPDVDSANIAFNMTRMTLPNADYIGPILLGLKKPIHILAVDAPVRRIINMSALAIVQALSRK
ncbi:MAG: NADP-dependent malic enzyme [Alphaproteobacteria bacterium CG_4_10_14_0_8_um_filter_53_9]|nr:MAG: NADP-dependent malic enzyme [Alphaproteobacteria bacterium CG_4_10_14_0_8_um_filter_53_9]